MYVKTWNKLDINNGKEIKWHILFSYQTRDFGFKPHLHQKQIGILTLW